ncbi:MAG: MFS transporter [Bacteroidales bacterium]|jgi:ACS family hexuronate transporter-like MFS transporter
MSIIPAVKIGNYRWRVVALLFFATTINYIDRQILGMLKPFIENDFAMSEAGYGYIVSAFQAAYAIGLLMSGRLIDKFGTRISYALAVVVWSLAGCFHAAARSAFGFGIARFFLGIGESANFPAAIKATAEWFPKKERALATGIFNAGSNMGALIAPVIVSVITIKFGWRWAFIITGLFGFVWVLLWLLFYKLPTLSPKLGKSELDYITDGEQEDSNICGSSWKTLFKQRSTIGICAARFFSDWVWWFFLFWTPDFLNKMYNVDIKQMVLPLIIIYLLASVGGIVGGTISSTLIKRGFSLSFSRKAAMLILAVCVMPIIIIPGLSSLWLSVGLIGLAAFAHQGWASNVFTLVSDFYPKNSIGSMTGLAGFVGSVGGILAAIFIGQVLDLTGSYFLIFAVASMAYLLAWTMLQLTLPNNKYK